MTLAVFSEIKWEYLTTRKQQLFSRFPEEWRILFLEPYKSGMSTRIIPRKVRPNILVATLPFTKNFPPGVVASLFGISWFRRGFNALAAGWVRIVMAAAGFTKPGVVVVSNLHAVPLVSEHWRLVYDMNDNHLAFEHTPVWLRPHFDMLCSRARRIVVSAASLGTLCPGQGGKLTYIGNGVDAKVFARSAESLPQEAERVVLYTGAVSEIIDFELMEEIADRMPEGYLMRLVGPVFPSVRTKLDRLLVKPRTTWVPARPQRVLADFVHASHVCLIPFVDSHLTRHVNPNKAYEYLACGKPVVAMYVTPELDRMKDVLMTARSREEFVRLALADYSREPDEIIQRRKAFARANDWSEKAGQYQRLLEDMCKE
jgi:glycosyltransferase involved in cell wall biosynthesis